MVEYGSHGATRRENLMKSMREMLHEMVDSELFDSAVDSAVDSVELNFLHSSVPVVLNAREQAGSVAVYDGPLSDETRMTVPRRHACKVGGA